MKNLEKNTKPSRRLGTWIGLFLLLSVINLLLMGLLAGSRSERATAYVQVGLLVALFGVLVVLPTDARERARMIDLEASAATLGITFWTALMYGGIAHGLDLPETVNPFIAAGFMFVVYIVAKALVDVRHR